MKQPAADARLALIGPAYVLLGVPAFAAVVTTVAGCVLLGGSWDAADREPSIIASLLLSVLGLGVALRAWRRERRPGARDAMPWSRIARKVPLLITLGVVLGVLGVLVVASLAAQRGGQQAQRRNSCCWRLKGPEESLEDCLRRAADCIQRFHHQDHLAGQGLWYSPDVVECIAPGHPMPP